MIADPTWYGEVHDAEGQLVETFGMPNKAKCRPDGSPADRDTPALQQSEPLPPTKPRELFFTKTLEFRLRGTDVQRRSIELPTTLSEYRIVPSVNHVRTFVTRGPESATASNLIGGVEVSIEGRSGTLPEVDSIVCTVQSGDFGPEDLVVVGVDITVFLLTRND